MKNGKDSTHKKRAFPKRLKKSRHKKEPTGFLWNPQSEFTSDEEKEQVSRLLPLELALFTSVLSSKACMQ